MKDRLARKPGTQLARKAGGRTDVFSVRKRSEIMARVLGSGNVATELRFAQFMRKHRLTGWRRGQRLFGSPDFVFRKQRVVVFVDGCFWHNCPRHGSQPVSNPLFWQKKLDRNRTRDRTVTRTLRQRGWTVLRVWQHELTRNNEAKLLARVRRCLAAADVASPPRIDPSLRTLSPSKPAWQSRT